ncbi:uncharacterized protein LDX57_010667 [Aspergillus melleus]|uniref:uncharacterized protein n=1 Tax=Aspergillus melleus TaxID=138277 RepID=UPI001E8DE1C4|nr:uncharacterized protein LDX57_010667 [Aspergillus melleus]KAH8433029.1 hypothetical protein LDX57_010667 [Aspergillus melleus]
MASPRSPFSTSSSSSSPSLYPSSFSSVHSPPSLSTNLSSASWSPSYRGTQDHLDNLIARHGHPTRVSLSSLEELTATSSTYNPPSPRPSSPVSDTADSFDALTLGSASRPIPIPKPSPHYAHDNDLPVTPLTGRFDKGYYFAQRDHHSSHRHGSPYRRSSSTRMRSDSSSFYPPVVSPSMSPTGRSSSPQPSRARAQNTSKSVPGFHLGSLPRFHPAVYQPSTGSQNPPAQQHIYRTSTSSRDAVWQYRELMEGSSLSKTPSRPLSPSPSAPRLDPLRSPGPVTPLALEDANGYLLSGPSGSEYSSRDHPHSGPAPDLVERLIARENERTRQKVKKGSMAR